MSIKISIIEELNLFLTVVDGKADDQIASRYQESILSLPGYRPTLNTLMDARLVTDNTMSPENLVRLSTSTPFDQSVKRAYVVDNEKAAMLATIFGTTSSGNENYFVTFNIDDACEWFGFSFEDIKNSSAYKDNLK